jgi:hypothetical protein
MAVTLNANSSTGFIATSDTSGVLQLQTGGTTAVSIGTDQSFNFSATGQRITGDFSNATHANRVAFQSSTTNGSTTPFFIPNGTGNTAGIVVANASDPTNCSFGQLVAGTTSVAVVSSILGTGTYLPMTFFTGGSESLRLSATTKAVILAGGSTSANGTGITFPATQSASTDANTLDDYEEGTWTPAQGSGLTVVGAYSSSGSYTKIGRIVCIKGSLFGATSVACTSNGQLCTGLPFTPASGENVGIGMNGQRTQSQACSALASGALQNSSAITATSFGIEFSVTYPV